MKGVLFGATVEGLRSRKDHTVALTLGTQELSPEKAGELFTLNGKIGTVYITRADVLPEEDIEIIDSIEPELPGKSPGQRLRAVLYLMWKNNPEGFKDQNLHYLHYMDKLIEYCKTKLPKQ